MTKAVGHAWLFEGQVLERWMKIQSYNKDIFESRKYRWFGPHTQKIIDKNYMLFKGCIPSLIIVLFCNSCVMQRGKKMKKHSHFREGRDSDLEFSHQLLSSFALIKIKNQKHLSVISS